VSDTLRTIPWSEVSGEHLEQLVEQSIPEGRGIEYKRELPETNDAGTREFLADVASFANSDGGHLIIGISDLDGFANAVEGIDFAHDEVIPKLDAKIQSSIEPRILGVGIRAIRLANGRSALVIRIPRSWNRPHMVTFKNLSRCYARNSGGKYQMDMNEIREQVIGGAAIAERVARFRRERVDRISADKGPVILGTGAKVILHALPFSSLQPGSSGAIPQLGDLNSFLNPLAESGWSHRINFDGLVTYSHRDSGISAYLQVFRHGMVETVNSRLLRVKHRDKELPAQYLDQSILKAVADIKGLLRASDCEPPVAWMLTLSGVFDYEIVVSSVIPKVEELKIDREEVAVPEVLDIDFTMEPREIARRLLDPVWQAGGWARSPTFE